jgi:hypothetical protein
MKCFMNIVCVSAVVFLSAVSFADSGPVDFPANDLSLTQIDQNVCIEVDIDKDIIHEAYNLRRFKGDGFLLKDYVFDTKDAVDEDSTAYHFLVTDHCVPAGSHRWWLATVDREFGADAELNVSESGVSCGASRDCVDTIVNPNGDDTDTVDGNIDQAKGDDDNGGCSVTSGATAMPLAGVMALVGLLVFCLGRKKY